MSLSRIALITLLSSFVLASITTRSAHADSCDDLAKQLAGQISNMKVGRTVANVIYLDHPAVKQAWLGCSGHNLSAEVAATSPARKPNKEFLAFIADASAVVFTIPKDDTLRGVQRCVGRIGLLRGNDIRTRYRKLNIRCTRSKDATSISVTRDKDV